MSDSKFVVFNCSRGPITITFYSQSSFENLSTMTSHHRRKAAKNVFKNVTIRNNSSIDLVAETGLPISELEKNPDLARFMMLNKISLILNSERVIEETVAIPLPIPQEVPREIPQEIPKQIKSEVIEEVVDPEELRRAILEDSMAIEAELLEEGNIFCSNTKELAQKEEKKEDKSTQKKKSGRPKKGSK